MDRCETGRGRWESPECDGLAFGEEPLEFPTILQPLMSRDSAGPAKSEPARTQCRLALALSS
jgi:hypothetical protein